MATETIRAVTRFPAGRLYQGGSEVARLGDVSVTDTKTVDEFRTLGRRIQGEGNVDGVSADALITSSAFTLSLDDPETGTFGEFGNVAGVLFYAVRFVAAENQRVTFDVFCDADGRLFNVLSRGG